MPTRYITAIMAIIGLLWAPLAQAQTYIEPTLTRFVHDYANVFSAPVETQLEQDLNSYAQKTDHTIVVATIPSLEGKTEQQFANELFNKWRIGRADVDNGLLVLVAPNERAIWIEVGYGLEGVLTDLTTSQIARTIMAPAFQTGDYDKGITEGVAALKKVAEGEPIVTPKETRGDWMVMFAIGFGLLLFGALAILFLVDNRKHVWPSGVLGGVFGAGDGVVFIVMGWSSMTIVVFAIGGAIAGYLFGQWLKKIKFDPTKYGTSGGGWGSRGDRGSEGGFSGHTGGSSGGGGGGARW